MPRVSRPTYTGGTCAGRAASAAECCCKPFGVRLPSGSSSSFAFPCSPDMPSPALPAFPPPAPKCTGGGGGGGGGAFPVCHGTAGT